MLNAQNKFMHRPIQNDEFASICTRCFATVGWGRGEEDLAQFETKHVCDKNVLYRLGIGSDRASRGGS